MKESEFQSKVESELRKLGCYVYKNPQGADTENGRPDLTVCVPVSMDKLKSLFSDTDVVGVYVGLELKKPKRVGGVSKAQKIVGRKIQRHGGRWFHGNDLDNILKKVSDLQNGLHDIS